MVRWLSVLAIIGSLPLAALTPSPLAAQSTVNFTERSNWFVGFVISPPRQMLGFGAGAVLGTYGGWGLLVDGKLTHDSPDRQHDLLDLSPAEAREFDIQNIDENAWTTLNLSLVRGLTPEFAVYAGGGISWKTVYLRFLDETQERGHLGFYWIEDPDDSRTHANVQVGGLFRMGDRLIVQFGGHSAPMGFHVGGHVRVH